MTEKLIESILNESRSFAPSKKFIKQANIDNEEAQRLREEASYNHIEYWAKLARAHLHWFLPFNNILDESNAPNYEWFNDGEINASFNSLDINANKNPEKTAIIFETEDGNSERITYKDLLLRTSQFANGLKKLGIVPMDRVVIYCPCAPRL